MDTFTKDIVIGVIFVLLIGAVIYLLPSSAGENLDSTDTTAQETTNTTNTTNNSGSKTKGTSNTPGGTSSGGDVTVTSLGAPLNQIVRLQGVQITTTGVLDDSRCPSGVNYRCVWEGTVRVLTLTRLDSANANDPDDHIEFTLGVPVVYEGNTIVLTSVTPYPREGVIARDQDYRFVWTVIPSDL